MSANDDIIRSDFWRCVIKVLEKSKSSSDQPEQSIALAKEISQLLADTRCGAVRLLDLRGLSPICDFLVVANGTSARQMRSAADDVVDLAEARQTTILRNGGASGDNWIAVDLFDIVIHIFAPEARQFYDLDGMWADAPEIEWKRRS
ncbi:MAG TPA: ribosome silencing factor [Tepidisphaeraceae bacterium]|nr:ribosome silencing factor [Tepidisphaeraceae bacterium]